MAADNRAQRLERWGRMSTEDLEKIIQDDLAAETRDQEMIFEVLEVLAERNKPNRRKDADTAWKEFIGYYCTDSGEDIPAYDDIELAEKKKPVTPFLKKALRISAAVLAAIILLGAVPTAFGVDNYFTIFAQWTEDVFYFVRPHTTEGTEPIESTIAFEIENSLDGLKQAALMLTSKSIIPTWMPEGYALDRLETSQSDDYFTIDAQFKYNDKYILIHISREPTDSSANYEKDETPVEIYSVNEINHYIMQNNRNLLCAWAIDNVACTIYGDLSLDELYMIIDSIYDEG